MDNMAFSLPFCLGRQGLTGLLQAVLGWPC